LRGKRGALTAVFSRAERRTPFFDFIFGVAEGLFKMQTGSFESYLDIEISYVVGVLQRMKTEQPITAPRLWMVLAKAYGAIGSYIEGSFAAQGIGLSDFMVLEVLLHKGPLTISMIGQKVLLASASMTSAIDRLEERGLVRRRSCSSDRRIRLVELTATGRAFIEEIYARHEKDLESIAAGLCDAERKALYGGLKKMGLAAQVAVPTEKSPRRKTQRQLQIPTE
jgi:MarR family 2-MHQ and catechol resistance regulon transcriptional repressor